MAELLWIIPFLPLCSALVLSVFPLLFRRPLPDLVAAVFGVAAVAGSFALTLLFFSQQNFLLPEAVVVSLGSWFSVAGYQVAFSFYLDQLTVVMMMIITGVGSLIHLFSVGYMRGDDGFSRFFCYLNLFVFSMLVLVLADDLVLLYLGWEGVGLCSFLLIGFWYKDAANGYAARKAFVVTRAGDTAMAIGLFLLFTQLGSLNIQNSLVQAAQFWGEGSTTATLAALLLLGGALGKSAQLPLHTWLPDAMAGPTPVSALIHAATMVTAGVYLVARMHPLFLLSELALTVVTIVGALTLFMAACSALVQTDIKRILAYSTMSQIGYMFYALGVGAWDASIFHLMTHAFFKALLFLAAGLVIISLHHQQDIFQMGGLRKRLPYSFFSFVIGAACLAALPLSSGFYSKDAILLSAYAEQGITPWWLLAVSAALLTGLYSFRLVFVVFFGADVSAASERRDWTMRVVLLILALAAIVGGHMQPQLVTVFGREHSAAHSALGLYLAAVPVIGVVAAYWLWGNGRRIVLQRHSRAMWLRNFLLSGWGFDRLYDTVFVKPLCCLAAINRHDVIDSLYTGLSVLTTRSHDYLAVTQNGQLRWYVIVTSAGAIAVIAMVML